VAEERERRVAGLEDERCPDRLLPEVLVHDPVLNPCHQILAEPADDGGVDPGCH
jgi:hypothetical protein